MKRFKRFLKNNAWILIALVDIAMILAFVYMIYGFVLETAEFYAFMNIYAG